eukprot:GHVH01014891.1.p1 GENE.GHVH01014891.1~~GHVH01014891.1.p1  ORF type:complete len:218 (-),score=37.64 GHVH01014891.1:121-774(-)
MKRVTVDSHDQDRLNLIFLGALGASPLAPSVSNAKCTPNGQHTNVLDTSSWDTIHQPLYDGGKCASFMSDGQRRLYTEAVGRANEEAVNIYDSIVYQLKNTQLLMDEIRRKKRELEVLRAAKEKKKKRPLDLLTEDECNQLKLRLGKVVKSKKLNKLKLEQDEKLKQDEKLDLLCNLLDSTKFEKQLENLIELEKIAQWGDAEIANFSSNGLHSSKS